MGLSLNSATWELADCSSLFYLLLLFCRSVVSNSLQPHGLQHDRLPCPPPLGACSKSCALSWWCHLILCHPLLLLPSIFSKASRSFLMSQFFVSGGQSIGALASASVLPVNIHDWFPLGLTGLISLQSKGVVSRVFSTTTVQKHRFFSISFLYVPTLTSIHDYWKNHSFEYMDLCLQNNVSAF